MSKFLFATLVMCSIFDRSFAKGAPGNLVTYISELPDFSLSSDGKAIPKNDWKKYAEVIDAKNGFVIINNEKLDHGWAIVLFKKKDGTDLVAMAEEGVSVNHYYFVEKEAGKWVDVKTKVFPILSEDLIFDAYQKNFGNKFSRDAIFKGGYGPYWLKLPRTGTTIEVVAANPGANGTVLFKLNFDKMKFVISK